MKLVYKTKPWKHQVEALKFLYPRNAGALYTDMGTGKTKVMIDLMRNRMFKRVLVVAPLKACKVWEEELKIHGLSSKFNVLNLTHMKKDEKLHLMKRQLQWANLGAEEDRVNVIIINYESVWLEPMGNYLLRKSVGIDTVICDESHRIKSPSSACSKYLSKIGRQVKHRYLITGTPLAENPKDVYAQYRFLDPSIFGTNFGKFCEEYLNIDAIRTSRAGYTVLNKNNPYKNLDKLEKKMFSVAFCTKTSIELPSQKNKIVKFKLSENSETIYKNIITEGFVELEEGTQDVSSVIARILREQQITSGFLPLEDEKGAKKVSLISAKRKTMLIKILNSIPKDEPVVIFAKFKQDFIYIREACEKVGSTLSELRGDIDTLKDWQEGKTRVIAVQYMSGSESISLVRAKYCIYYSLTHSLSMYKQSKKRIHRPKQTRDCVYYHIIATSKNTETIDESIMKCLKTKQNIVNKIMGDRLSK